MDTGKKLSHSCILVPICSKSYEYMDSSWRAASSVTWNSCLVGLGEERHLFYRKQHDGYKCVQGDGTILLERRHKCMGNFNRNLNQWF